MIKQKIKPNEIPISMEISDGVEVSNHIPTTAATEELESHETKNVPLIAESFINVYQLKTSKSKSPKSQP